MANTQTTTALARLNFSQEHTFMVPLKRINEGRDVSTFLTSRAYVDVMTFVMQLNRAMFPTDAESDAQRKHPALHDDLQFSETVTGLRSLLDELEELIESNPPDPGPRRFGNASFRKWYEAVESRTPSLLRTHVPSAAARIASETESTHYVELESYLLGSFGSAQRLDYGTGHELSFLAFLGCIWKVGGFQSQDSHIEERSIVLGVIEPYLRLVRKLIKVYTLEPAGSHGVWGLDDHSFLPYVFGSAQYGPAISNTDPVPTEGSHPSAPDPADVTKAASVERLRKKNMYFDAIGFIYDVKTGPFWEHSPTLYDISGVKGGWGKINKGMIKMYNAEVLSKFPVVQHFRFGSLFSWERHPSAQPPPPSAHSSSQPDAALKSEKHSSTGIPTALTAAPWAAQTSNGSITTAAPSTRTVPAQSRQSDLHKTPIPRQSPTNSAGARQRMNASRNPRAPGEELPVGLSQPPDAAAGMPPPTRAPWAK